MIFYLRKIQGKNQIFPQPEENNLVLESANKEENALLQIDNEKKTGTVDNEKSGEHLKDLNKIQDLLGSMIEDLKNNTE